MFVCVYLFCLRIKPTEQIIFQCFFLFNVEAGNTAERILLSFVLCWHWLVLCSRKYIFSLDLFLLFSCCFLLLTLLFYSLDIRRGENNRFHTHTFIFVIVAYCVLVFVLFRFLCSIGSLSLCCVCVLFHIRFAFKRFNNSTKGDFQKYLCRKIELVVLCVILCLLFSSFCLNHFVTVLFLSFMSPCVIFNALYSLALFFLVLLICLLFFAQSLFCVASF